jgi:hypothetical protein
MLPLWKSKIVLMTPADILANRPAPPPSTKSAAFATEPGLKLQPKYFT